MRSFRATGADSGRLSHRRGRDTREFQIQSAHRGLASKVWRLYAGHDRDIGVGGQAMAPYRAAVMVSGLLCAALLGSPSSAADLGVQTPSSAADLNVQTSDLTAAPAYFTLFQELRVGAFAHNLVHNENAPVDLSFETISSNIGVTGFSNPFVAWFLNPRVNFGAMINVEGKTSYAFGGFQLACADLRACVLRGRVRRRGKRWGEGGDAGPGRSRLRRHISRVREASASSSRRSSTSF